MALFFLLIAFGLICFGAGYLFCWFGFLIEAAEKVVKAYEKHHVR